MRYKISEVFVRNAGLEEGLYFAKEVEGVKLRIIGKKRKNKAIPIIVERADRNTFIIEIPDSIVEIIKHRDGSEIDLTPAGDIYIL